MEERFRFTGQRPPPGLLGRFPNWEPAYDEECMPNQDESTLRPADNQRTIDDEAWTAGDAILGSNQELPALLYVLRGELCIVYVYPEPPSAKAWAMRFDTPSQRWVPMNEEWFLQGEDDLPVALDDSGIFPIQVTGRLPLERSSDNIRVEIAKPPQPRTAAYRLEKWKRRREKRKR
jgi:hypothetical protein